MDQYPLWPQGAPFACGNGPEDQPVITPYPASGVEPRGAVIIFPGGGYVFRAPHEGEPVARWLNELGITAFVLDYRVAPYRHPVPLCDAQRAVRWVRHHAAMFGVRTDRVGVLGFSAGGHLAATLATHFDLRTTEPRDAIDTQPCRPDAAVLCYPVITFTAYRHHGSMVNLLGDPPDETLRELLSNELHVTPQTPPAFLWHTADDDVVPVENSLLFAQALSRHKVPFELHVYPHGRHGLGLAEDDPVVGQWTAACAKWLAGLGFCAAKE